ncbi:MAG: tetratricopeptide repeat protein [Blastocatellia bacterium]|nr:tetratricopeptide repeat protein [Blastocatellia bacterium]
MKIVNENLINSIIKKAYFYLPKILLSLILVIEISPYSFTQVRLKIDDLKPKKTRLDLDSISTSTRLNLDSTTGTKTKVNSLTRLNLDEYGQKLNIKQIGESSVQTTMYVIDLSIDESGKKPIKRTLSEWELLTEKANKIIDKEIIGDSDIEEAVKLYNKALELNPKTILPYLGLGYAHLRVRNFEKSVFYYQEATKQNPKNIEAKTNLAVAIYYTGKIDEAIKEYTEALTLSKNLSPELNFNLAIA